MAADRSGEEVSGANRELLGRLCDSQSRQSERGTGMDARGAGAVGTDTERKEDEPPECPSGAIRLSGLYIRAALQPADWLEVHWVQSVKEERATDQRDGGRHPEAPKCNSVGRGARPAESNSDRLENVLRNGEYIAGIPGDRRTCG